MTARANCGGCYPYFDDAPLPPESDTRCERVLEKRLTDITRRSYDGPCSLLHNARLFLLRQYLAVRLSVSVWVAGRNPRMDYKYMFVISFALRFGVDRLVSLRRVLSSYSRTVMKRPHCLSYLLSYNNVLRLFIRIHRYEEGWKSPPVLVPSVLKTLLIGMRY